MLSPASLKTVTQVEEEKQKQGKGVSMGESEPYSMDSFMKMLLGLFLYISQFGIESILLWMKSSNLILQTPNL